MSGLKNAFNAPWGRALKVVSVGAGLLFTGIVVAAVVNGADRLSLLFVLLLLPAVPFVVRGYAVEEGSLVIRRLGWETRFSLQDLQSADVVPHAMKGAIRLFGNGGLFSITGLYRNKTLGNFRSFANDMNHTVVLRFSKRTIVVSPDDPAAFVTAVCR